MPRYALLFVLACFGLSFFSVASFVSIAQESKGRRDEFFVELRERQKELMLQGERVQRAQQRVLIVQVAQAGGIVLLYIVYLVVAVVWVMLLVSLACGAYGPILTRTKGGGNPGGSVFSSNFPNSTEGQGLVPQEASLPSAPSDNFRQQSSVSCARQMFSDVMRVAVNNETLQVGNLT